MNNKLQAKDLINIGIFTTIYFVIYFATMMLGYIPILDVLLGLICPITCGIPFMLYVTKVRSFGMISITGIILAILFTVMGSGLLVASFCIENGQIPEHEVYNNWICRFFYSDNGFFQQTVFHEK